MKIVRAWAPAVVAGAAVTVGVSWGRYTYPVLLTTVQADLGLTYTVAGGLASANLAAYLVGTVVVTLLAERVAPGALLLLGSVGSVLGLAAAAVAADAGVLLSGLIVTGASGALVWVSAPAVGISRLPAHARGVGFGVVAAGIGIGLVSAAVMSMLVGAGDHGNWRRIFVVQALVAVVVALGAFGVRSVAGRPARGVGLGVRALWRVPRGVALVGAYMAFAVATSWGVGYLVAMAELDRGMSPRAASVLFLFVGTATIAGGVVGGRASQAFGHRAAIAGGLLLIAISALGIRFGGSWLPYASAAVFGTSYGAVPVGIAAYLADHVHERGFSAAWGTITVAIGPVLMVSPHFGGVITDMTGDFTALFVGIAIVGVAGAGLSARLAVDRTRGGQRP